jgi:uncharacterized protein
MSLSEASSSSPTPRAWWREPMVWMVIGGPLAVVVAGILTAVIAIRGADTVLTVEANPGQSAATEPDALTPAVQARNHVQTARP